MAATLFILNDPPYGTERSYSGLRLAGSLARREGEDVRVSLLGDAAACAKAGQKVSTGYYNLEVMLRAITRHGGQIGVCGTCLDARGIAAAELAEGCTRSTLEEPAGWTAAANRVLVF
ncbi:MAG: DsrE family protein [Actinomycetota bacterium]